MKVLVKNHKGTAEILLDLAAIPQKGEYLMFSILEGMDGLTFKEKKLAEESTSFIDDDNEENEGGNHAYIVTEREFHNNGVVVLYVREEYNVLDQ